MAQRATASCAPTTAGAVDEPYVLHSTQLVLCCSTYTAAAAFCCYYCRPVLPPLSSSSLLADIRSAWLCRLLPAPPLRRAIDGDGILRDVPANMGGESLPKRPVVLPASVVEQGGFVWVFFGDPALPEDERPPVPASLIPELSDPENWQPAFGELEFESPHFPVFENALDFAHVHYVHSSSFGSTEAPVVRDMRTESEDWGVRRVDQRPPPCPGSLLLCCCGLLRRRRGSNFSGDPLSQPHSSAFFSYCQCRATFTMTNKPANWLWEWTRVPEVKARAHARCESGRRLAISVSEFLCTAAVVLLPVTFSDLTDRFYRAASPAALSCCGARRSLPAPSSPPLPLSPSSSPVASAWLQSRTPCPSLRRAP